MQPIRCPALALLRSCTASPHWSDHLDASHLHRDLALYHDYMAPADHPLAASITKLIQNESKVRALGAIAEGGPALPGRVRLSGV